MNKLAIVNSVTRSFHKVGFQLKKHSPEILAAAGVVGVVTSAVLACKATMKVNDVLDRTKEDVDKIHYVLENAESMNEVYTEEDAKKDLTVVYAKTGLEFAKLYAPAIILGTLSITSMLASNNILRKRNVALAAAYTAVDTSFKEYRGRVVERFGEALDRELRYNIKAKEIEETVVDEKTGEEKKVKRTVEVAGPLSHSQYARFFDNGNEGWEKDPEYNLMYLRHQQNYANELLRSRGYVFLNDVYDMLDIRRTKAGQIVGWVYDKSNPNIDNYIDFGIYNIYDEKARDFVNGYECTILLDFNVDGPIIDKINPSEE